MRFQALSLACVTVALAACNRGPTRSNDTEPRVDEHSAAVRAVTDRADAKLGVVPGANTTELATAEGSYAAAGSYMADPTSPPAEHAAEYSSSPADTTQTTGAMMEVNRDQPSAGVPTVSLKGKTIAILATNGVEQVEITQPRHALDMAGAVTVLIAPIGNTIQGMNHSRMGAELRVDKTLDEADPAEFSGLLLPGGVANPDALRQNPQAVAFVKAFVTAHKPIAAICHGPWMLIEADGVRGKKMTSFPSLKTDLTNAGAHWTDRAVVDDHGLVTSRNPDDIPEFMRQAIVEFAKPTGSR